MSIRFFHSESERSLNKPKWEIPALFDEDINALADFFYFAKYAADNVGIAYIAGESCAAAAGSKNFMFGFSQLFD